ncbi:hypothetical protein [Geodermatophilus sp. CPCC 205761]|uniref:hypothetical protein n=1 Tax=Geodermatophilus sp. CPCC 205761 TaxID=2936597 RepID=UPI003EF00EDE
MADAKAGEERQRGQDAWPRRLPRHLRRIRPGLPSLGEGEGRGADDGTGRGREAEPR